MNDHFAIWSRYSDDHYDLEENGLPRDEALTDAAAYAEDVHQWGRLLYDGIVAFEVHTGNGDLVARFGVKDKPS